MRTIKSVPAASSQRPFTVIAQDPTVTGADGEVLTTQIMVPAEQLEQGPWGYRIQIVDWDSSSKKFMKQWNYEDKTGQNFVDPFAGRKITSSVLADPRFHAQNVYAIAMRTLARFEFAFGRRVGWAFPTHQLKIAPHAFLDANAFYDRNRESLQFGYFPKRVGKGHVFTCLSHDIVAHETTHAILDGLHRGYVYPSGPDQAAFHEAFSDIVALLSVFSLREVVGELIRKSRIKVREGDGMPTMLARDVSIPAMRHSLLLGLAEQFGEEINVVRGSPLRQSLLLKPSRDCLSQPEFQEPHRRGEVLVAAVLNAFLHVFDQRVRGLDASGSGLVSRDRVVEEAAKTADHLLTIAIRALDYCVPVHVTFSGYLTALLTSDSELVGDDTSYHYRKHLVNSFEQFGISPLTTGNAGKDRTWRSIDPGELKLNYSRSHFSSLQTDREEVFRFIWENRKVLGVEEDVYTRVVQVKPCLRISPDGFPLRETMVQYLQIADVEARELSRRFQIKRPDDDSNRMPLSNRVTLRGGGTLIFDQHGQVKFNINTPIAGEEQSELLLYLWERGHFREGESSPGEDGFSHMHRHKAMRLSDEVTHIKEAWL